MNNIIHYYMSMSYNNEDKEEENNGKEDNGEEDNGEEDNGEEEEDKMLDTKWLDNFEEEDKKYEQFYKEDVQNIKLHYIYVNKNNEIEEIVKDIINLSLNNCISREELVGILKKTSYYNNKRYTVLSILKYNIDIEPNDISHFLMNQYEDDSTNNNNSINNIFLSQVRNIDTIILNKTVLAFQDLNDIIIIFYEKSNKLNQTKKIYIKNQLSITTKNKIHKKTVRLQYENKLI